MEKPAIALVAASVWSNFFAYVRTVEERNFVGHGYFGDAAGPDLLNEDGKIAGEKFEG
jgi:hypothetical protein